MIEVKAHLNNLRVSPKKVRLVTSELQGLDATTAMDRLYLMRKNVAPIVAKLLASAIANALHNNNLKKEDLIVKRAIVNEAMALKRWKPAAFGSAHAFKKRGSHITVILTLKDEAAAKAVTIAATAAKTKDVAHKGKDVADATKKVVPTERKSSKDIKRSAGIQKYGAASQVDTKSISRGKSVTKKTSLTSRTGNK